jgi:hypothetical protein
MLLVLSSFMAGLFGEASSSSTSSSSSGVSVSVLSAAVEVIDEVEEVSEVDGSAVNHRTGRNSLFDLWSRKNMPKGSAHSRKRKTCSRSGKKKADKKNKSRDNAKGARTADIISVNGTDDGRDIFYENRIINHLSASHSTKVGIGSSTHGGSVGS